MSRASPPSHRQLAGVLPPRQSPPLEFALSSLLSPSLSLVVRACGAHSDGDSHGAIVRHGDWGAGRVRGVHHSGGAEQPMARRASGVGVPVDEVGGAAAATVRLASCASSQEKHRTNKPRQQTNQTREGTAGGGRSEFRLCY